MAKCMFTSMENNWWQNIKIAKVTSLEIRKSFAHSSSNILLFQSSIKLIITLIATRCGAFHVTAHFRWVALSGTRPHKVCAYFDKIRKFLPVEFHNLKPTRTTWGLNHLQFVSRYSKLTSCCMLCYTIN